MNWSLYENDAPTVSGIEKDIIDTVSAEEPWALVERFAELERISGTDEERVAASYLTDRLHDLGVNHEVFNPELYLNTPHNATIETNDGWRSETAKTVSFSASDTGQGELAYVENDREMDSIDAMLSVSLDGLDDDLTGQIVMSESIIPITAIEELANRGAEGFIGIHPHETEPHEGIVTPIWGGAPPLSDSDRLPDLLIANVSKTEGQELREQAQRNVEVTVTAETTTAWQSCPLVLTRIPGEAAPDTDEFVLVHGHIDSWHVGVTDNATGDAALLEIARVLHEYRKHLRRDVWVAWWPGHSTGRYAGSTWFADEFAQELSQNCIAHVNVDSPGVAEATEYDSRVKWMAAVHNIAERTIEDVSGKETVERRPPRAGDYSFSNLGIPGMSLQSSIPDVKREERGYHPVGGSGGHADAWHLTTDTIEKADPDVLVRDTEVYALATVRLSRSSAPLDPMRTLERHQSILTDYDGASEFDLGPVIEELDALRATMEEYHDMTEGKHSDELAQVIKVLTRLNFTSDGEFEQDPAESRPAFPRLAKIKSLSETEGDDRRFLELELRRARNEVTAELRRASKKLR